MNLRAHTGRRRRITGWLLAAAGRAAAAVLGSPALIGLGTPAVAQDEHATAWPDAKDEPALKLAVQQVHKATSDEMAATGLATIQAEGAAAAPLLLKTLLREKDDEAIERVSGALDAVTTRTHTRLLAESFEDNAAALRRYALRRVAVLGDKGLRETAEALVASFEKRAESRSKKTRVEDLDLDLAAALALSTGSLLGVERSLKLAGSKSWSEWSDTLEGAAAGARAAGDDVASAIAAFLAPDKKDGERVAALRLLTYAGSEKQARAVRPLLDSNANHLKVAAVNALRMMVDGDPPLKKLSAFDAIERAQKWKTRI